MSKVFVSNIHVDVNEKQLHELFSTVAEVISVKILKDNSNEGISRGFGFVEFGNREEAKLAIKNLNGKELGGKNLAVSHDRSAEIQNMNAPSERAANIARNEERSKFGPPLGFFRAQPLDLGIRRKKKADPFEEDPSQKIDFKDSKMLIRYMSDRGRILPRRMTGLNAYNQRKIAQAIKRAQHLGLLPITNAN